MNTLAVYGNCPSTACDYYGPLPCPRCSSIASVSTFSYCTRHLLAHSTPFCSLCKAEAATNERDALNILEARIADQDGEIGQLRRRITDLEHRTNDRQAAHNALAAAVEALEGRLATLAARAYRANLGLE